MIRLISVFTVLCLLAGCESDDNSANNDGQNGVANMPNNGSNLSAQDREFIQRAAIGGMTEVDAGQIAMQRGSSNQLRQFAQQMVDDHSRINNELVQLAEKKGVTLPSDVDPDARAVLDKLNALSGNDFDDTYTTGQYKGHVETIKLFQNEANNGQDADVKAFATRNLPTIKHHLDMIKSFQSAIGTSGSPELEGHGQGNPNSPVMPPSSPSRNDQTLPPENQTPPVQDPQ